MDYNNFLKSKLAITPQSGIVVSPESLSPALFDFQKDVVRWAVRKGRCALFLDTGLGKTVCQTDYARLIGGRSLIIAPLSVVKQTVKEAKTLLNIDIHPTRSGSDLSDGINITNYEMIEHFNAEDFKSVILDESSILKSLDGKTRKILTEKFTNVSYKLCCTATPAPNDVTEIGRHSEFLGVMTNAEMLAAFFINDQKMKNGTYRLKGHAVDKFYEWLSSWALAIKKPSDAGYDDSAYVLPPLTSHLVTIDANIQAEGMLTGFNVSTPSAIEAKKVRRQTIDARVEKIAGMVNGSDQPWVIWADLNDETNALAKAIPGSVNVYGTMSPEAKADALQRFVDGDYRVLITKPTIAGFGINMQRCANTAFCGIGYSWEQYYQAVRRFWRFGQKQPVNVYVVTSEQERSVYETVIKKDQEATAMTDELVKKSREYIRAELKGLQLHSWEYREAAETGEDWQLLLGDSVERIKELPENSVDMSVFSPPFVALYTYTPTERDLGNSRDEEQFFEHFQPIIDGLLKITKPGRNCCVHVQQVAATKGKDGYIGIKDFRGDVIRAFIKASWIFHGEVTIDKNPQVQAIRTKTKGLMFAQLHKDSVSNRMAFGDYILIFQKPGENAVPVIPDVTNEEWIQWAHPVWYDIRETDVLNVAVARSDRDERHICPLQLPVIERCVRLYTNKGETVFSPFAGIGSEGYEAVKRGRKFIGIELKPEYFKVAITNLKDAEREANQGTLWDLLPEAANA